jgi:hypothetical protein
VSLCLSYRKTGSLPSNSQFEPGPKNFGPRPSRVSHTLESWKLTLVVSAGHGKDLTAEDAEVRRGHPSSTPALCVPPRPLRLICRRQRWTRQRFNRRGRRGAQRTPDRDAGALRSSAPSAVDLSSSVQDAEERGENPSATQALIPAVCDAVAIMPSPDHPAPLSNSVVLWNDLTTLLVQENCQCYQRPIQYSRR